MFKNIELLLDKNPVQGITMIVLLLILLSLVVWNSVDDIKKQSIVFYKLLITGLFAILAPVIYRVVSGKPIIDTLILLGISVLTYFILLALNIMFNGNKLFGQGDVDIVASWFSLAIGQSVLFLLQTSGPILGMQLSYLWFNVFAYFTVGLIVGTVVFLVWFIIQAIRKKTSFRLLMKDTRIPVIPMLIIPTVMISYTLMLF